MADRAETPPRLRVILERDNTRMWRWHFHGERATGGPWVRVESAVENLERVLGVQTQWVKPKRGWRQLEVIGRPIDVEIRR